MTPQEIIDAAIEMGMACDPRGRARLEEKLGLRREDVERLPEEQRRDVDPWLLASPFGDTSLVTPGPGRPVDSLLVGIEIGVDQMAQASKLRDERPGLMVISHHTKGLGHALRSVSDMVEVQTHQLISAGVPEEEARRHTTHLIEMKEKERKDRSSRVVPLAERLGLPLGTVHAPADLLAYHHILKGVAEARPERVGDFLQWAATLPEFHDILRSEPPLPVKVGSCDSDLEPCYFCLIGGWNPVPEAFEALSQAGIRTVVMVECSDPLRDIARRRGMNVVILPHYPFDSLGLNLFFDRILWKDGSDVEIFECSNFVRIQRALLEK